VKTRTHGFTLLELLMVVAIMALATAGVSLAMRDSAQTQLEREAQRLAALLESARAQSRASGVPVRWQPTEAGFRFDGLPSESLPQQWMAPGVHAALPQGRGALLLGPEPVIGAQQTWLSLASQPGRTLVVATDGLRPFAVQAAE
jgi:general secretion pathway protein H